MIGDNELVSSAQTSDAFVHPVMQVRSGGQPRNE